MTDRRRLLDKLLRELVRCETQAIEHAPREARRLGMAAPPVAALCEVGGHALEMRARFQDAITRHELAVGRHGITATLTTLRHRLTDRLYDAERSYRGALLDLRHGLDVVRVLREVSRLDELFALIRWCDDWLAARRTLVAGVEAQLSWFVDQVRVQATEPAREPAWHDDRNTDGQVRSRPKTESITD